MTSEERATARARCEKATPGPWNIYCYKTIDVITLKENVDIPKDHVIEAPESLSGEEHAFVCCQASGIDIAKHADAQFIADARTDLPSALDEIERLEKRLEAAETVCDLYEWWSDDSGKWYDDKVTLEDVDEALLEWHKVRQENE